MSATNAIHLLGIFLWIYLHQITCVEDQAETLIVPLKYLEQAPCTPNDNSFVTLIKKEYENGENYSIEANIQMLLAPLGQQCFVGVDNFRSVELLQPTVPVLIRKPLMAILCEKFQEFQFFYNYVWGEDKLVIHNVSVMGMSL